MPEPTLYPKDQPVPRRPNGDGTGDMPICAICRQALYEDDQGQSIRITGPDTSDEFWRAYTKALAPARRKLETIVEQANRAYDEACRPRELEFRARVNEAEFRRDEAINLALQTAPSQEAYDLALARIKETANRAADNASHLYEAQTADFKAERDNAIFRAGADYRQACLEAMANLPKPEPSEIQEGCYSACRDCVNLYRPRIRERLIRQRVVSPGAPLTAMQGNLLL